MPSFRGGTGGKAHGFLLAAVYTQLSDIEDEINGLLTFDREVLKLTASDIADQTTELRSYFLEKVKSAKDYHKKKEN